jgi:hypothetical protein
MMEGGLLVLGPAVNYAGKVTLNVFDFENLNDSNKETLSETLEK